MEARRPARCVVGLRENLELELSGASFGGHFGAGGDPSRTRSARRNLELTPSIVQLASSLTSLAPTTASTPPGSWVARRFEARRRPAARGNP
jgi:hypothetical protein